MYKVSMMSRCKPCAKTVLLYQHEKNKDVTQYYCQECKQLVREVQKEKL